MRVAGLGQAVIDGMLDGGVLPVIKHIPGHGRAGADSHLDLPVVETSRDELERSDFAPFRALSHAPNVSESAICSTAAVRRWRASVVSFVLMELSPPWVPVPRSPKLRGTTLLKLTGLLFRCCRASFRT